MKIYVAAAFKMKGEARRVAGLLRQAGHEVTATWLDKDGPEAKGEEAAREAALDLEDVERAETLLLIGLPYGTPYTGGGRQVEFGYALALGKRMILIGDRETVFACLPVVENYPTIEACIDYIESEECPLISEEGRAAILEADRPVILKPSVCPFCSLPIDPSEVGVDTNGLKAHFLCAVPRNPMVTDGVGNADI